MSTPAGVSGPGLGAPLVAPKGAGRGRLETSLDEVPMPPVTGLCKRCPAYDEDVASGYVVVSPSGKAHHGADYGVTGCGIDATGPGWWWPL